ncbi:2-hydroxyacid dehydrogenase [Geminicoccus harenae]|uniref:2-hydroxyacid dehydrogenase n=1 Tax=Geminicoccus harenae TaxID=2498453 RepID=UPI001C96BBE8|nr:2-hydroxyacid dehydrogenase [Geminicoccus harenae]
MSDGQAGRVEIAAVGAQRPEVMEALERHFTVHRVYEAADPLAMLREVGPRVRGVASHGMAGLSRAQIELMPNLEICAINGVGLETTDLPACRERNITVCTAPVLFDDVADLAVALALAACRKVALGDRFIRQGSWQGSTRLSLGRKLTGMRVGILGLGRIGREVAHRLAAFKTRIGYYDPVRQDVPYQYYDSAVALAGDSDLLVLCAAGGPKGSPPLVPKEVIEALGPRGIFVNIARGWLVDEPALVDALVNGRLGAAGLDVFHDEPSVPEALLRLDNVVLTPHVASSTEETMGAMGECVVGNLVDWFAGKGARTPIG